MENSWRDENNLFMLIIYSYVPSHKRFPILESLFSNFSSSSRGKPRMLIKMLLWASEWGCSASQLLRLYFFFGGSMSREARKTRKLFIASGWSFVSRLTLNLGSPLPLRTQKSCEKWWSVIRAHRGGIKLFVLKRPIYCRHNRCRRIALWTSTAHPLNTVNEDR